MYEVISDGLLPLARSGEAAGEEDSQSLTGTAEEQETTSLYVLDKDRTVCGYYANGYIYDKNREIIATYSNGYVKDAK